MFPPTNFLSEAGIQSMVRQMEGHPSVPVWIMFWVEMANRCFPINPRLGLKWKEAARTTNLAKALNPTWTKHYKLLEENHTWFPLLHKINKIDMREILVVERSGDSLQFGYILERWLEVGERGNSWLCFEDLTIQLHICFAACKS